MLTHIHQKFYRSNITHLSKSDIIEIRESRRKVPNASKKMAKKFHIGACHKPSIIETPIKKIKSKHVCILDQPSINKNLTGKLSGMSLETKKTILPETLQETKDILELHKRIQKEKKKFRTVAQKSRNSFS
ncbi:hypothetical protein Glove_243g14 [Diversispora epigaea]|uniref:Uncharacterized protein n=1 Tax=Diversispora epigaea TaxID=1348612 RepID=A0A397IDC2_9GLOM|nr:hypothetical protein Glove_243g14 [Diversispora epigaea]